MKEAVAGTLGTPARGKSIPPVVRWGLGLLVAGTLTLAPANEAPAAEESPPKRTASKQAPERASPKGDAPGCKPLPPRARIKVSLAPDTEIADLVTWYSNLTCTPLVLSSGTSIAGKKVTILSPVPVTPAQLHHLFLGALDSVGLTVQQDGRFLHIIDAARARHSNTPVDTDR